MLRTAALVGISAILRYASPHGVSLCTSIIYLNGKPTQFHVDGFTDLESAAALFCQTHVISSSDCDRIVAHHRTKCFPAIDIVDTNELADKYSNEEIQKTVLLPPMTTTREKADIAVDYTQPVGPTLSVTDHRGTMKLQAYAGETREQSVKRFCGMMKLNADQCGQVAVSYGELCKSALEDQENKLLASWEGRTDDTDPKDSTDDQVMEETSVSVPPLSISESSTIQQQQQRRQYEQQQEEPEAIKKARARRKREEDPPTEFELIMRKLRRQYDIYTATVYALLVEHWRWFMLFIAVMYAILTHPHPEG